MGGHGKCKPSLYPAKAPSLGIQVGSPLLWVLWVALWGTLDLPQTRRGQEMSSRKPALCVYSGFWEEDSPGRSVPIWLLTAA